MSNAVIDRADDLQQTEMKDTIYVKDSTEKHAPYQSHNFLYKILSNITMHIYNI